VSTTPAKSSTTSPKTVTKTTKVVNNNTGVTTSTTVVKSGGSTSITKTKTIGAAKTVSPVKLASPVLADQWIAEPNDKLTVCGPLALANSLLAVTGVRATTRDILRLYSDAGGSADSGVTIEDALAAAASTGLAGCRVASFGPVTDDSYFAPGRVLGLDLAITPDGHAAATDPLGGLILWGLSFDPQDVTGRITEAWALTWQS
jgi:hypothetical protein